MQKFCNFIVNKRIILMLLMVIIAGVSAVLMKKVEINEDMTKYLPDSSDMKQGMDIMNAEFPEMAMDNTIRVMFDDLSKVEEKEILEALKAIEGVNTVTTGEEYHKDNHTLYIIGTSCEYGSEEELAIEKAISENFTDYKMAYANDDISLPGVPTGIVVGALAVLFTILFLMCASWIEPVLYLLVIGIAIAINMGTNLILGTISSVTNSIVALLQLVLSMDYSVILSNRYRQECRNTDDHKEAMKKALRSAFSSVAASSLTTVAGLLMLVFMQFKIGMDLGIVLAKGVFISMVCVITILPGVILLFDKIIAKTAKKTLHIPMKWAARMSFKFRIIITILLVGILGAAFYLQTKTDIAYTLDANDKVAEVFPTENMFVIIYENADEKGIEKLTDSIENDSHIKSINSYYSSMNKPLSVAEMTDMINEMSSDINLDESVLQIIYYMYNNGEVPKTITIEKLLSSAFSLMEKLNISMDGMENASEYLEIVNVLTSRKELIKQRTPDEIQKLFNVKKSDMDTLMAYYNFVNIIKLNGSSDSISIEEFLNFVKDKVINNLLLSSAIDDDTSKLVLFACDLTDDVLNEKTYTPAELCELINEISVVLDVDLSGVEELLTPENVELVYLVMASLENFDDNLKMSIDELITYISTDIINDERFAPFIDDSMKEGIQAASWMMAAGKSMLVGENYGRMIITTDYLLEADETNEFLENIHTFCDENMTGKTYIIGNSEMNYEMKKTFSNELLLITAMTAGVIFIIVALTFRSVLIPAILVSLVQGCVYVTVSYIGITGNSIFYLALLIVECILMGATIDYGILFTNYYCENRKKSDVQESLQNSYEGATHTILTSGLILILVTAIIGNFFSNPTISAIVATISIGSLTATLFILLLLPGVLACFDKVIIRKNKR